MTMFVIEDELHAEHHGQFAASEDALTELRRRAKIPWDAEPNQAPCQSGATCGRAYGVIEFDDTQNTSERAAAHEGVGYFERRSGVA
jgi:hypothetical protein